MREYAANGQENNMVKETKRSVDSKIARKFIRSLAQQLTSDSDNGSCLVRSADLEEVLRRSAEDLPAGKLRSTLLCIQEEKQQQDAFVVALQEQLRAVAAKREVGDDVVPTTAAKEMLFETLWSWLRGQDTVAFAAMTSKQLISPEGRQLLLCGDPPPHVLWALAALELSSPGAPSSSAPSSVKALLLCLKPLVVGHRSACTAVATLAPLAPLMFEALQQSSGRTENNIKAFRAVVREVLSFIVVVNNKEKCTKDSLEDTPTETLTLSSLLDGFSSIFQALKLHGPIAQMEVLSATERLKLMFPLASKLIEQILKPPDAKVVILSNIVKIEFVLLQMILEVIHWRGKMRTRDKLTKSPSEVLNEMVGTIAVNGVAAAESDEHLILDLLLSHLSVGDMLDDEEKALIYISLYKALLVRGQSFIEKQVNETSATKKKNIRTFLKRIAVARKIICGQRSKGGGNILEELASKLNVPYELAECLKSGEVTKKPPDNVVLGDQALIGWLLHLEDMDFQAIVDGTSGYGSLAHKDERTEEEDHHEFGSFVDRSSSRRSFLQTEAEALFFVDTTGEEEGKGSGQGNLSPTPSTIRQGRKSRKRKERQVLFQRQGHLTVKRQEEKSNDSSSDSMIDDRNASKVKRRHQGGETSAL